MEMKNLIKGSLVIILGFIFFLGILSGSVLAGSKYKDFPVPQECMDQVRKEGNKLFLYDWAEWWPEKIFKDFEEEFGVKITRDHFADSEEMIAKFKLNPKAPYDLVLGVGPMHAVRLNAIGLLKEINHDWIPNVDAYLVDVAKNWSYDPGNHFQLTWNFYYTNYGYNSQYVDPNDPLVGSWKLLFDGAEKYSGKITMIDNMYNTIGAALKYLGYSWNSDNESELMEAKEVLLKQKPHVVAYDSWPRRLVMEKEAWISQMWNGDPWYLSKDAPTYRGVVPREGTFFGAGTNLIPKGGQHPATAHLFLNYIFRTEVNAFLIEAVGKTPAHKHVMEFMSDKAKAWPGFVLDPEWVKKCDTFEEKAYIGKGKELRAKIWEELKR